MQHYEPECHVEKKDVGECQADIFWTTEPFVTKLGVVMHHHGLECHAERLMW